ncbi:hypothetical protein [Bradyrhizobium sp. BR 1432]|uniref:hypothetical protein n=1 Tax=Bradyrhizobium sp. BR 1432 TaxID=3447966 RepID=UPI003EE7A77E
MSLRVGVQTEILGTPPKERAASLRKSETDERRPNMQSTARTLLVFAAFSVAAVTMAPALYADDHASSSSTTMVGMMGRGSGMMERIGMMNHCGAMMGRDDSSGRPNDQWRAPRSPDAKAKQ